MDIWKFSCHAPAHKYLAELGTYTHKIAGKRNWTGDHICHACAQCYHDSVTSFNDVFELIYVNDSTLVKTCHYYGRSGIWDTLHFNSWDADANKITYTRMVTCDASVTYDYSTEALEFVDHYYNPPHDTEIYYVLKAQ